MGLAPAAGLDMLITSQEVSESIFMFYVHRVFYGIFYHGLLVILKMMDGGVGIEE